MNIKINLGEASTKRGIVVLFLTIVGTTMLFTGLQQHLDKLLLLTTAISGFMKVTIPDNLKDKF